MKSNTLFILKKLKNENKKSTKIIFIWLINQL